MKERNLAKTSLTLEKNDFEIFKLICKKLGTNTSEKVREFIKKFNEENQNCLHDNEKTDVKIVIRLNQKDEQKYEEIKNLISNICKKFGIYLELEKVLDDKSKIEYYTKAIGNEYISNTYLRFLENFIDLLQVIEDKYKIIHLPAN